MFLIFVFLAVWKDLAEEGGEKYKSIHGTEDSAQTSSSLGLLQIPSEDAAGGSKQQQPLTSSSSNGRAFFPESAPGSPPGLPTPAGSEGSPRGRTFSNINRDNEADELAMSHKEYASRFPRKF